METEELHAAMVAKLKKPGKEILKLLTPEQCDLIHMGMGIAGEAGELLDAIKKHTIYNQDIDMENIIEELGDIEWYLAGLRASLLITRERTLRQNMNKLATRYKGYKYSDKRAKDRADKK
jgi:NTP pyrophosphatase (non-canonical NTP hydrolase)